MDGSDKLYRYLVYKSAASKDYLCVCAARDRKHALAIARQSFDLTRTAYARPEILAPINSPTDRRPHKI